jgi:hypothetical protein
MLNCKQINKKQKRKQDFLSFQVIINRFRRNLSSISDLFYIRFYKFDNKKIY